MLTANRWQQTKFKRKLAQLEQEIAAQRAAGDRDGEEGKRIGREPCE